ncbi:MAG TPA: T9SS type A sorting domain-containing protein, partial [Ignavibacteria bacterium]|nr:T9SS type A sorting domain-containing protein [Ignavibacteria bacterium]
IDVSASTGPPHIYKTYDGGSNWIEMSTGLPSLSTNNDPVRCISISTLDTSVVLSALFMNDTAGGAYLSTNGGASWTKKSNGISNVTATLLRSAVIRPGSNTEFYIGFDNSGTGTVGLVRTTNAGNNWVSFNGGSLLSSATIRALVFKTVGDTTLYAGAASTSGIRGIHEYSWPNAVNTGGIGTKTPDVFMLEQNYPNPFNPVTKIAYTVPVNSTVRLNVFNAVGQKVKTLVDNEFKNAGSYEINFDAGKLSSGVYFYRIEAGTFISTKKMILIK